VVVSRECEKWRCVAVPPGGAQPIEAATKTTAAGQLLKTKDKRKRTWNYYGPIRTWPVGSWNKRKRRRVLHREVS